MSALQKLQALLAKVQARANEPRVSAPKAEKPAPRAIPATVPFEMASAVVTAPVEALPPAPIAEAFEPNDAPIEISFAEPEVGGILVQQDFDDSSLPELGEPAAEAVSGEFEVAASLAPEEAPLEEEMLELEELGPADELEPGETVVESVAMDLPLLAREERISRPPESGRELVAAPHESARMAVAAPATPDPNALELEEVHEPPPVSSRNLRASPSAPSNSDIVELAPPPRRPEPIAEPIDEAPVTYAPHTEPPPPPVVKLASVPPPPPAEEIASAPTPAKLSEPPTLAFARIVAEPPPSEPPMELALEPIEVAHKASEPPVTRIATGSEPPPPSVEEAKHATEPPPPVVEARHATEPPPIVEEAKHATEPPPIVEEAKLATEPPIVEEKTASEPTRSVTEPPSAPLEPVRAAVAVQLAPIARPVEHVVVAIDADVINPEITPSEVAAFVSAVRAQRPASFGALLDAALDL